jgi:hypothetical protein
LEEADIAEAGLVGAGRIITRGGDTRMNTDIAIHVFASLQGLEKTFGTIKQELQNKKDLSEELLASLPKQEEILVDMRRAANLLQLHLAKKDWVAAIRSLQIYYGLNHLVRPDIIKAFGTLASEKFSKLPQPQVSSSSKNTVFH